MKESLEALVCAFAEMHPEEAAHVLERLEPKEAALVLESLPRGVVGPVSQRLTPHAAAGILRNINSERTKELVEEMTPRQAAVVLEHLGSEDREAVLTALPESRARQLRDLLRYPPETAGGIMTPQVTSIAVDLTAEEAIAVLRRAPRESLYYLYVTDREGKLVGVVTMRDLLLARPKDPIETLVRRDFVAVPASVDREEVATMMRQRGFLALPVIDDQQRLLGVVEHEEVLDTVQQEAFEDLQRMVGAGGDESALSPVRTILKRRLPWLYLNLVTAFAAAAVISLFEPLLGRFTTLAVLLPIVSALGGNSGAQTLAVVMRGLALREIMPGAATWLILKEVRAGLLNGIAVALVTGIVVGIWSQNVGFAIVIGMAMIVNMLVAGLAGTSIPLALKFFGRDPAQSSQIFLTTITDIIGFLSFLSFAALFAGWLK